jgi:hypothetical protein
MILFFGLKMKSENKKVKPIDLDIHLEYVCPNKNCLSIHWLSLLETQTKNFKVVCDCGKVFYPKRIKDIQIIYHKRKKKILPSSDSNESIEQKPTINFIDDAISTLIRFGFDKDEASSMIIQQYAQTKETNPATLVKLSLDFFGVKNG